MPCIGLGFWKMPNKLCEYVVHEAIKIGYRCIDEAYNYGNEIECGLGIKKAISEGIVKREEMWVTSKLWKTYHRKEHVRMACLKTLKDLGLEYLDLYLVHFPIALKYVPIETRYPPEWLYDPKADKPKMEEDQVSIRETWEAMEDLVKEGLVRNIGLANFGVSLIRDILNYCKIRPAVLQIEAHPYLTQERLLRFCREKGIAVTAFSPLGASSYVEIGFAQPEDSVLKEKKVEELAKKYAKNAGQIVLRWGVQRGTSLAVKSSNLERMKENLEIFDFFLTGEEMKALDEMNRNKRFNDPGVFCQNAFNTFFPIYE